MPFLTDCNTLYPGSRKNALEHMDCANLNGFNTITTGCQIIIGDGLRGTDVYKRQALLFLSRITYETIRLSYRSSIALR